MRPVWNTVICFLLPSQDKGEGCDHNIQGFNTNGSNQDSKKMNKYEANSTTPDKSDVSNENINDYPPINV